jgi:hypothetical protein
MTNWEKECSDVYSGSDSSSDIFVSVTLSLSLGISMTPCQQETVLM